MCGRMTMGEGDLTRVVDELGALALAPDYKPSWNIAPTRSVAIVSEGAHGRTVSMAKWGLPARNDGVKAMINKPVINLQAERVSHGRYADLLEHGRCVVPVDGFYEWTGAEGERRPIWFHAGRERRLLYFAGLAERDASGDVRSFAVMTIKPNDVVRPVHDRMPVVLDPAEIDQWFRESAAVARRLMRTAPEDLLVATPVSARANSVKNDDPSLLVAEGVAS